MATEIVTSFDQQCDASGDPMSGAKIYVYDAGTTTPRAVYNDDDLDPSHEDANPIICDSAGRHDMRYTATGSYKIVVKTSADVTVYTRDNIDGRVPVGSGALAITNGGTGATSAGAALSNLGAATAAELADLSAEVSSISGSLASTEKTHIATGTTAQRPATPVEGDIRRNTTTSRWEGRNSSAYEQFFTDTEIASQAQAEAGSNNTTVATPLRVAQGIAVLQQGWKLILSQSASSSATIDFTVANSASAFNGTYDRLVVVVSHAKPATDDVEFWMRVGTGAGPTYQADAGDYAWFANGEVSGGGHVSAGSSSDTEIAMTRSSAGADVGNATGENFNATIEIDAVDASDFAPAKFRSHYISAGGLLAYFDGGGLYKTAEAITALRFLFESGNIASGTFTLYGIKLS